MAGSCSVCAVGVDDLDQKAVLGYCLARAYWSKGYTTEAVREVLRYLFEEIGLNRIEASHSVNSKLYGLTRRRYFEKLSPSH